MTKKHSSDIENHWQAFAKAFSLNVDQLEKFKLYASLLITWNEKFNLTAITSIDGIIDNHFIDSLSAISVANFQDLKLIADIGSGAGFPGIPLKILFPNIGLILIEVNHKKRQFLAEVVEFLKLENVEICEFDFRTFLRKTEGEIDIFLSRASLDPVELIRVFSPISPYKNAKVIYYASNEWEPALSCVPFVKEIKPYSVKHKKRKLALMSKGI